MIKEEKHSLAYFVYHNIIFPYIHYKIKNADLAVI